MEPLNPGAQVLVATFSAAYGQFRKYYTNMSPLSFPVPSGTVLRGMLGAICGIDRLQSPEYFASTRLALRVQAPIRKTCVPVNLLKTVRPLHFARFENRKPTTVEYVRNAAYRVYIHIPEEPKQRLLREKLQKHHSVYTLCFGNSESLANYDYHGEETVTARGSGTAELNSMVPTELVQELDVKGRELFSLTLPVLMDRRRVVSRYTEFLFERNGKTVKGSFSQYARLSNGENIVFF